jgi:hypothetical protein
MNRTMLLLGSAFALGPVGCSHMNQTEKGVLAGGAIGAGAGTLIGAATGNPKTGAVVGGLLGAGVGGLAGNEADRKDEEVKQVRQATAEQAYRDDQPNRIDEIIRLAQQGQDETVILNHIRNNRMTFRLNADDLSLLKSNNVSPRVIAAMQNSGGEVSAPPRSNRPIVVREQVVVREPVYVAPPPPVMIVDPYCPPAVGFHVRGRFR